MTRARKLHYRKNDTPDALCGRNGGTCDFAETPADITCATCLRVANQNDIESMPPAAGFLAALDDLLSGTTVSPEVDENERFVGDDAPYTVIRPDAMLCDGCGKVHSVRSDDGRTLLCRECRRWIRKLNQVGRKKGRDGRTARRREFKRAARTEKLAIGTRKYQRMSA